MSGPSLTHFPIGTCDLDRLVIFTTNQDIGLSGGNQLCGNMTGQHGESQHWTMNPTIRDDLGGSRFF